MEIKTNKTARFLAASLTTGLAASAGNAAVVQITLANNKISLSGGNQMFADVTGDGLDDFALTGFRYRSVETASRYGVEIKINNAAVWAFVSSASNESANARFAAGPGIGYSSVTANLIVFNELTIYDARINGGAATNAYLEIDTNVFSMHSSEVAIMRLIFDDASTGRPSSDPSYLSGSFSEFTAVPEPSGLSLLALGAGGLLARRRRLAA